LFEAVVLEGLREELKPFTASLSKTIKAAAKFNDQGVTIGVVVRKAGRNAHV